jgi:hypothetical protein
VTVFAARIAAMVRPHTMNSRAVIRRAEVDPGSPDRYRAGGSDWELRCQRWDLVSAPLDRQIEITARGCSIVPDQLVAREDWRGCTTGVGVALGREN